MPFEHASVESTQPSSGDAETQEQQRWLLPLGLELTVFSAAVLALFASGIGWLVLLALAAAPIAGPLTLVYLAISSDTNGPISGPPSRRATTA